MTSLDLDAIEARAKAALAYERSEYVPSEEAYVSPAPNPDAEEDLTCPLCDGDGYIEGQRYDSKETYASTVVAYGIGKGLALAEEWVEKAPADILALVSEVRRLQGITPELPPRPDEGGGLLRYGLRWSGPTEPLAVPMDDGYWTPWHLATAAHTKGKP